MIISKQKKLWPLQQLYVVYMSLAIVLLLIATGWVTYTLINDKDTSTARQQQALIAIEHSNNLLSNHLPFELATVHLLQSLQQINQQFQVLQKDEHHALEPLDQAMRNLRQHYQELMELSAPTVSEALKSRLKENMQNLLPMTDHVLQLPNAQPLLQFYQREGVHLQQAEQILEQIDNMLHAQTRGLQKNLQDINSVLSDSLQQQKSSSSISLLLILVSFIIVLPLSFSLMLYLKLHQRFDALRNYVFGLGQNGEIAPPFRANDQMGHIAMAFYRLSRRAQRHAKQLQAHANDVENARIITERLTNYDPLTGLVNRRHFSQLLEKHLHQQHSSDTPRYLLFLDLDNFKEINDMHGHHAGDRLLRIVSARLESTLRPEDLVARLGGDEFSMIITCPAEQITLIAQKILSHVAQPISMNEKLVDVSVSIGITTFDGDDQTVSKLLKQADMAMYQAKASGKNNFAFYSNALEEEVINSQNLLAQAKQALNNNEFVLHYQPKVDLQTRATIGCEALIRWNHPDKGLLAPAAFLPVLEHQPLMLELEKWVLHTACQQAAYWVRQGHQISLAVNVTIRQFFAKDFVASVQQTLQKSGLPPQLLELEITETMLMDDIQAGERILNALRELGITIAIDDFGTGYSSLGYLQELPLDCLKLDRSFVNAITHDSDPSIIDAIINLGHRLNLKVVAEGIETNDQYERLKHLKCDIGQGYLFSRPIPYEDFLQQLNPKPRTPTLRAINGSLE